MTQSTPSFDGLSIERVGHVGVIHLDRVAHLNALSMPMIQGIHQMVSTWQSDDAVQAILIRSNSPKAFCAGGDIRFLYDSFMAGNTGHQDFFAAEYAMLDAIRAATKPVIAVLDGYVLGGGMGLAQACHLRISTEKSRFAMPETAIGYFPDVGATYFLSRLNAVGLYMALSSAQIDYRDALALGCIDAYVQSADLPTLYQQLCERNWHSSAEAQQIIAQFSAELESQGELLTKQAAIEKHFNYKELSSIEQSLAAEQDPELQSWATQCLETLSKCSYLAKQCSIKLHWAGRDLSLEQAMQLERDLQPLWFKHGDLIEGVRALIVDKDKQPKWQADNPAFIAQIDQLCNAAMRC